MLNGNNIIGKRICLIHMEDQDPIPPGTKGTVIGVNAAGWEMKWDNGRTLSLIPEEDTYIEVENECTETDQ
jgi:hypothetical protein